MTIRERAIELYTPPFRYEYGYIFDSKNQMVADKVGDCDAISRIRGWGRMSYLPNAEELQDEVGKVVAEALTKFWSENASS